MDRRREAVVEVRALFLFYPARSSRKKKKKKLSCTVFFFSRPHLFSPQKKKNRAYGDLSRMPKTASIVAVSLNNGPIQTGDAWHREQGHFCQDAEDW